MQYISFYLKSKKPNKQGQVPLIAQLRQDNQLYRRRIGNAKKMDFLKRSRRLKEDVVKETDVINNKLLNSLMDAFEKEINRIYSDAAMNGGSPAPEQLEKAFKEPIRVNDQEKEESNFFSVFEDYIKAGENIKAQNTIKNITTIKNFLQEFEQETGHTISFQAIDNRLYDAILNYAYGNKGAGTNYVSKIFAVLKTFLNWAGERDYYTGLKHLKFKAPEKEIDVIFLTQEELFKLYNHEFINEKLEKTRDVYCFACFTGLRYSDLKSLRTEHVIGNRIEKTITKTRQKEIIPLNKFALEILAKYKHRPVNPLPAPSNQKLNDYIKEACREAEINTPTTIRKHYGNSTKEETQPKHEFITMHTARKTFITNSLMMGMNLKTLKEISGHKKDSSFNKYIRIVEDFKTEEMDKTWNKLKNKK